MNKVLICVAMLAPLFCLADSTLFEARFYNSLVADKALGGGEPTISSYAEIKADAGRYGSGLDLTANSSFVAYPAPGNIDLDQGTLRFWFKPVGWKSPNFFARLFGLGFDPEKRGRLELPPGVIALCKLEKKRELAFYNFKTGRNSRFSVDVSHWDSDTWVHIVITWEKNGKRRLYFDGLMMGEDDYFRGEDEPKELLFGSPYFGHDCHGLIDEILILNRPLTAEEVAADHIAEPAHDDAPAALVDGDYAPIPVPQVEIDTDLYTGETDIIALYTTEPIVVDGVLDEQIWEKAIVSPPFITRRNKEPDAASEIRIVYDDKHIYFAGKFDEPMMEKIKVDLDQHDQAIYNNDCFELVLDTEDSPESTFHLAANMIGGIYDARNGDVRSFDARNAQVKGVRGEDSWTLEFAIPFADLQCKPPLPGESWGVRLCRERYPVRENSSYPVCPSGPFSGRADFAKLVFQGTQDDSGSLNVEFESDHFMPGINRRKISLINRSGKPVTVRLLGTAVSVGSSKLNYSEEIEVKAGSTRVVELDLLADLQSIQLALQAMVNGKTVWRAGLKPGFVPPPLAPSELLSMLSRADSDVLIWEASQPAVAASLRRNIEALRGKLTEFQASQSEAVAAKGTVSEAECARIAAEINGFKHWLDDRRLLVWEVSPWENGSPGDLPVSKKNLEINFRQAGNEWEFRAIAIAGILPGGGMDYRLAVDDLYSMTGERINRSNMIVYQTPYVRNVAGQLVIDPLVENDSDGFTVLPGSSRRFWLALHSRDMAPGRYTTTVTVKPLDPQAVPRELWQVIPVNIEVLPFSFPATHEWPMDTYLWHGGYTPYQNEIPTMEFLHRHHVNWVTTDRHRYDVGKPVNGTLRTRGPAGTSQEVGKAYFNPENITANDDFLRMAASRKMNVLFAWNICRNPEWVKLMSEHMIKMGFSYDQFIFSGMGDEFRADALPKYLPFHEEARKVAPKVRWMSTLTTVPPPEGCTEEQLDEVMEYIKTPILFNAHLWPRTQERSIKMTAWLKRHPELHPWIYRCSRNMQTQPLLSYYRMAPLNAHLCGVKGLAYWAMSSISGNRVERNGKVVMVTPDGFFDQKDPDANYFDGMFFWHPRKNLIPTKRFMALVKGLEDVALINMLKAGSPDHALIQEDALLELHNTRSQDTIDEWRKQMQDAIIALQE